MKITVGNCDGKKSFSRNRRRWEGIIKMVVKGIIVGGCSLIYLAHISHYLKQKLLRINNIIVHYTFF